MRKIFNWMLAATLVCGASVMTSCTSDTSDTPAQEQAKKNRKEFVEHTRATMKDLAENLNFTSWNAANNLNLNFNQSVLNNPECEKAVLNTFMQKVKQSIKPVEEGSELATMGYKMYGTVNHTGDYAFSWSQNGRKMLDLTLKQSRDAEGGLANLDLTQFTSMSSILDVLTAWMTTRTLDEAKLTLLDDLTTTLSISDMTEALELARASASARRHYADEATIDQYT